jgi:signal transduction histidine kinase
LFSDFVQIDSRVQKRLRGTGLGLSLSKKFAELLGGRVAVQSKPGKGSRFSVSIPARYRGQD